MTSVPRNRCPQGLRRPRFSFFLHLSKSSIGTMRLPQNIQPSDLSRRAVRMSQEAAAPTVLGGGAVMRLIWPHPSPLSTPESTFVSSGPTRTLKRQDFDPDRGRAIEARQFRGSVWRRPASAAASMGGYLGRSIPAVNKPREVFATVRFRTVGRRKKPRFRGPFRVRLTPDKMGPEALRLKGFRQGAFPSKGSSGRPCPH